MRGVASRPVIREAGMRLGFVGLIALTLSFGLEPAGAAVVLNRTGNISDLLLGYDGESQFTFGIFNIPGSGGGPLTTTVPLGGPPKSYPGPRLRFDVSLTTSSPVISPSAGPIGAYWYDVYQQENGIWVANGGNDGMDQSCLVRICGPVSIEGNKLTFSFLNQDYTSWGMFYSGTTAFYYWLDRIEIVGDLPISALEGNYSLTVAVSDVPEPEIWIMLLVGFALVGVGLRTRDHRGKSTPKDTSFAGFGGRT